MRSAKHGGNNLERVKLPYGYGDLNPTANFGEIIYGMEGLILGIQPFIETCSSSDHMEQNRGIADTGIETESWSLSAQDVLAESSFYSELIALVSSVPYIDEAEGIDVLTLNPMFNYSENGFEYEVVNISATMLIDENLLCVESIYPEIRFIEGIGGKDSIILYDVKVYSNVGYISEEFYPTCITNETGEINDVHILTADIAKSESLECSEKLVLTAGLSLLDSGYIIDGQGEVLGYGEYGYGEFTYGGIIND